MKTIESLDFPLRVYFKDGECHHDSAVIVFTHGAPAYVRASGPFVVYPWENIKHIIRVADEAQGDGLMGKHKVLREENIRLHKLHTDKRLALHKALGLLDSEDLDHAALCERVASLVNNNRAATTTANINAEEVKTLRADLASMTEQRDLLKRQLDELRDGVASQHPNRDKIIGSQRQFLLDGTGILFNPPAEPNADNRDSYRGTALRAGAKDCTLFVGPKPSDLTFVVEMREGCKVFDVVAALEHEHGLRPEAYRIREVRAPAHDMCVHGKQELECPECSAGYG